MKIKTKKIMNLPQLLEWAIRSDSDVLNKLFKSESMTIQFDGFGNPNIESKLRYLPSEEKFDVEVEEEITEDTEFGKLYYTTILSRIVESSCTTIQSSLKHIAVEPIAFYILNDDLTMTLIWREGKLVE